MMLAEQFSIATFDGRLAFRRWTNNASRSPLIWHLLGIGSGGKNV